MCVIRYTLFFYLVRVRRISVRHLLKPGFFLFFGDENLNKKEGMIDAKSSAPNQQRELSKMLDRKTGRYLVVLGVWCVCT